MAQLVSHSAGFPGQLSVASPTLQTIIPPLVRGQLAFQPGKDWRYGPGVEIQGYLIEKWAGKDLSDFLQERLFQPLGMQDTGFFIAPNKASRVSKLHQVSRGELSSTRTNTATTKPARLSPSGGLYSTAQDYYVMCQMLLNKGEYKGKRYLTAESVKLMHTNNLEPQVSVKMGGRSGGIGFGVDFAIVLDTKASKNAMVKECFYWGGAYGTWFWIDPTNDVVFVGMIQNSGGSQSLAGEASLHQISAKHVYNGLGIKP